MPEYTDALGITLYLPAAPKRIISLVPSQTELLYHLGLGHEVVGITKFCVHPKQWHQTKTRVGGTKQLHIDVIQGLQPDLVIANKEENRKEDVETIGCFCPVYTTHVRTLEEALQMTRAIGNLLGKERAASILSNRIAGRFSRIPVKGPRLRAAYLIWKNPYIAVGGDTFIHDMMQHCQLDNVFAEEKRYPHIQLDQLREKSCDLLLLSSEPYPFKEKDVQEMKTAHRIPATLVDGEMFSWYGSRMLEAASYFTFLQTVFRTDRT